MRTGFCVMVCLAFAATATSYAQTTKDYSQLLADLKSQQRLIDSAKAQAAELQEQISQLRDAAFTSPRNFADKTGKHAIQGTLAAATKKGVRIVLLDGKSRQVDRAGLSQLDNEFVDAFLGWKESNAEEPKASNPLGQLTSNLLVLSAKLEQLRPFVLEAMAEKTIVANSFPIEHKVDSLDKSESWIAKGYPVGLTMAVGGPHVIAVQFTNVSSRSVGNTAFPTVELYLDGEKYDGSLIASMEYVSLDSYMCIAGLSDACIARLLESKQIVFRWNGLDRLKYTLSDRAKNTLRQMQKAVIAAQQ